VNSPTEVDQELWKEMLVWQSSANLPADSLLSDAVEKSEEFGSTYQLLL